MLRARGGGRRRGGAGRAAGRTALRQREEVAACATGRAARPEAGLCGPQRPRDTPAGPRPLQRELAWPGRRQGWSQGRLQERPALRPGRGHRRGDKSPAPEEDSPSRGWRRRGVREAVVRNRKRLNRVRGLKSVTLLRSASRERKGPFLAASSDLTLLLSRFLRCQSRGRE